MVNFFIQTTISRYKGKILIIFEYSILFRMRFTGKFVAEKIVGKN